MNKQSLGKRVKHFREYLGLNQGQLSEEIGLAQSVISEIEGDKYEPSIRFFNAMMLQFAANPEWIKTGKGEMFISPEEYISRGIELLGAKTMSEGFLTVLKDHRFAEFHAYLSLNKFEQEQQDTKLQELLQLVSLVWQRGDERTHQTLEQFLKAFPEVEGDK